MRLIPVVDLARGRAVLARCGARDTYRPVRSMLLDAGQEGDPIALVRAYQAWLQPRDVYVADLDAIRGAALQLPLLKALAALAPPLLVDAAVTTTNRARELDAAGAARVIVALETLASFDKLVEIVAAVGRERVVFSLDLRAGIPIVTSNSVSQEAPMALVDQAVRAGVATVVIVDLVRIGTGAGVDCRLLSAVRRAHPTLELLAGGGVRDAHDLERLAAAGCDGALVATALHSGTLDPDQSSVSR